MQKIQQQISVNIQVANARDLGPEIIAAIIVRTPKGRYGQRMQLRSRRV